MITAGWLLYAVIAGGEMFFDLTIKIKEYPDKISCEEVAEELNAEEMMKTTQQYEYYCIKNPTERV